MAYDSLNSFGEWHLAQTQKFVDGIRNSIPTILTQYEGYKSVAIAEINSRYVVVDACKPEEERSMLARIARRQVREGDLEGIDTWTLGIENLRQTISDTKLKKKAA